MGSSILEALKVLGSSLRSKQMSALERVADKIQSVMDGKVGKQIAERISKKEYGDELVALKEQRKSFKGAKETVSVQP